MIESILVQAALVKSLNNIYKEMFNAPISKVQKKSCIINELPDDIHISIDVTFGANDEEFDQPSILTFPEDTYLKIASEMFMEEYDEINEEIEDVGLEVANMMLGRAKAALSETFGAKFELTLPTQLTSTTPPAIMHQQTCHFFTLHSPLGTNHLIIKA
jgi:CheY-specific phosphatase CheX